VTSHAAKTETGRDEIFGVPRVKKLRREREREKERKR
jgi:hypothetical protein